jgi:hypothetical protein
MDLSPKMVYPMHGLCIDSSMFSKYTNAIIKNDCLFWDVVGSKVGSN